LMVIGQIRMPGLSWFVQLPKDLSCVS